MDPNLVNTFWRFVYDRQAMKVRRDMGKPPPWTDNPILANNRWTNVYRADDRVSQFLIREVLYDGTTYSKDDLAFRAILFRIFNLPNTWRALERGLRMEPLLRNFNADDYADILTEYRAGGNTVFNNAYMMCGVPVYSNREKHRNWLYLLREMVRDGTLIRVAESRNLRGAFDAIRAHQLVGDFLAMQWTIDVNYSVATNHSESEYIVPGPGAVRGLAKLGHTGASQVGIEFLRRTQEQGFATWGVDFPWLGGRRRLQSIDIQACLCEFDKYLRAARPDIAIGPKQIKQRFDPAAAMFHEPIVYFYPPKWRTEAIA